MAARFDGDPENVKIFLQGEEFTLGAAQLLSPGLRRLTPLKPVMPLVSLSLARLERRPGHLAESVRCVAGLVRGAAGAGLMLAAAIAREPDPVRRDPSDPAR